MMVAADTIKEGNHHGSVVAHEQHGRWHGAMIVGAGGSGKSDLALRLIDRDWRLVADDRTILRPGDDAPLASAPDTLAGKLSMAGIGIVECDYLDEVPIALVVQLENAPPSYPLDSMTRTVCGFRLPLLRLNAFWPSAPILVERAYAVQAGGRS